MIDKLVSKIQKLNAPIVVGLDPNLAFVPDHIKKQFEGIQDPMEAAAGYCARSALQRRTLGGTAQTRQASVQPVIPSDNVDACFLR